MKVSWFSGGLSSAIATILADDVDAIVRIWIYAELNDCMTDKLQEFVQNRTGINVIMLSSVFRTPVDVARRYRYISSPYGAPCTQVLKRDIRLYFERFAPQTITEHVFGYTADEAHRASRIMKLMPEYKFHFPLIERGLTKSDVLHLARRNQIPVPHSYELFEHNNCIGCLKSRSPAYWIKIRRHFPEVFHQVARLERELNYALISNKGSRVFLDELPDDIDVLGAKDENTGCSLWCLLAEGDLVGSRDATEEGEGTG